MLRLLVVTAHPDDEAAGFGGTLLLSHERGVETYVICLTAGQAATHRGGAKSDEELAAMRREEFAAACEHLHVTRGEVVGYPDGKLDRQDFHEVAGELTRRVREICPHVMLTFGTEGGITAHPDHSMASIYATMAFQWAPRTNRYKEQLASGIEPWRPQKLYYSASPFQLTDRQPIAPAPCTVSIDIHQYLQRKIEAFRKHTTQAPLFDLFERHLKQHDGKERFHLAARSVAGDSVREEDIFSGVIE